MSEAGIRKSIVSLFVQGWFWSWMENWVGLSGLELIMIWTLLPTMLPSSNSSLPVSIRWFCCRRKIVIEATVGVDRYLLYCFALWKRCVDIVGSLFQQKCWSVDSSSCLERLLLKSVLWLLSQDGSQQYSDDDRILAWMWKWNKIGAIQCGYSLMLNSPNRYFNSTHLASLSWYFRNYCQKIYWLCLFSSGSEPLDMDDSENVFSDYELTLSNMAQYGSNEEVLLFLL